ncbi:dienelactone hydrolase family protein [Salinactinospora qingdaonensis]|uniref:Dienelactone hydrolase family protein n=1 Tax=Salinactinospora qingdaonensis TaxID=702744 RepID=A0ABP7FIZ0_9ACTN
MNPRHGDEPRARPPQQATRTDPMPSREVSVEVDGAVLTGDLSLSPQAQGVVLFAHGSGSSRHSPRNREVARTLNTHGFATLLIDLLTIAEEQVDARTRELRFDIPMLTRRLTGAADWLATSTESAELPLGLFGASTGAAAALGTAAERPKQVHAVVSRGGRPDLAGEVLPSVTAPVLLIVGSLDEPVIRVNYAATRSLRAPNRVHVVPGASHLFEEPGTLEQVTGAAMEWFRAYLQPAGQHSPV